MECYEVFRIHVSEKNNRSGSSVAVTSSLDSRKIGEVFKPPFDQNQAELLLHEIGESFGYGGNPLGQQRLVEIGKGLYDSVFSARIGKYFGDCLKNAKDKKRGLRIELIIDPLYLRRLPWELMHDGNGFLALSTWTPIVRSIMKTEFPKFDEMQYPLGISFVAASPIGPHVSIDVGGEIRLLCQGISKEINEGKVLLRCYGSRKVLSRDFFDDLKSGKFGVLHVSSHGGFVKEIDKSVLQLEDEVGKPLPVSVETLGEWVKDSTVQMVYLDACKTGVGSVRNPLADLSHVFLDKGVGAVVAMQYSVSVGCANTLCHTLYAQLAEGEPLEYCMSQARTRAVDNLRGLDTGEWAIPVLYMYGKDLLKIGGERKPKKTYKAIPAVGLFVGREQQLNRLTEYLVDPDVMVVLVDGFGGIGKSATVRKLVRDVHGLFADVCWIDCQKMHSHDDIVQEINEMLRHHGLGNSFEELAKCSPDGKNDMIAGALEQSLRFLVVLDNFDSVVEKTEDFALLRNLMVKLGDGKQTKVLVTLRFRTSLARRQRLFTLDKLDEDEALVLIRKLADEHQIDSVARAEDSMLRKINARVDGHPKAIEVLIPNLKAMPLDTVLEGLPQVLAGDIGPILKWSFGLLAPKERELLLEVSVYEGSTEYDALKAVHLEGAPFLVKELVEKNLLSYDDVHKLYGLHPLVRDFACSQLSRERRRKLHRLAARYLTSDKGKDPVGSIYHMYRAEDWKAGMSATADILEALILRGFWTEAKSLCDQGLIASRKVEGLKEESYFLFNLASMFWRLGEPEEATRLYKQNLEIDQKLGDQQGISASLHQLANIECSRGNYEEATKLYKQNLDIKQKLGDQKGIALSYGQIGLLLETRNQLNSAKENLEEALEIFRQLGDKPHINQAEKDLQRIQAKINEQK